MVGVICSNIELNNVGWNTFPHKNKYNLLIYKLKHPEFKSRTRYGRKRRSKRSPFFRYPEKPGELPEKSLFTETAAIMEKKTILATCAAATLAFTGCSGGFSAAEEETIHAGKGEIMRILTVGNPADSLVLRQKAAPVTGRMLRTDDYAVLRRRMLATVQDPQNTGVGIAAPQVGILRRMIAVQRFDKPGEPFEFYLNPEIVESSAETAPGREGCLSIPGLAGTVVRAQRIVLRYRDERFAEKTETIDGFTAVIFQHETDHLDGILYTDRMDEAPTPEE